MISYVFPPMAAVGGYRVIKFCKFLPAHGWQPVVLTVKKGFNFAYDHQLLEQVDESVTIYRSGNFQPLTWWDRRSQQPATEPKADTGQADNIGTPKVERPAVGQRMKAYLKRMLSIPDRNNFWIPFGLWSGLQAIRQEKIDVIYSTSPPASAHLIGCFLSVLSGKPLVMDFRDLWTQNEGYHSKSFSPLQLKVDRWLEKRAIRRSRAIVTATDSFSDMIRAANPGQAPSRVFTINNGVDPDDFSNLELPTTKNDKFSILHLGSLYGNRNPLFFFEALREWVKIRPEIIDRVRVEFIGNAREYERYAADEPLKEMVTFPGHIPNKQVLPRLWQADLLLLLLGFDARASGVLPAKLFEYICTDRPILAFVPAGEASNVLKTHGKSAVLSSPDTAKTVDYLDKCYLDWQASGDVRESKIDIPPQFDRRRQAAQLAEILDSL